ncbi:MAG TPA: exodeoxyribonuclease VII large subunit [Terriglobales bacterium]|nr:exodeoxyribonuclease VII large subunit [Terriglobales bacterium]
MGASDQLGFTFQPPQRRIWTVHDLVGAVRTHIERAYTDVYVEGEISNFKPAASGHLYFTLKDDGAQIRAVMFRSQARLLRFRPADGLQVIARGRVTVYEDRGELQLLTEYLEPKGAGALQIAFEQLKAKLAAEGLFAQERKKPIPAMPRCVGVVTSPRGAAVQDILNIMRRRHSGVHVLIYPAQVQGDAAALEVSAGIRYFNREKNVDVIIVARGGGSIEDLAAFNNEGLARTVAGSALPVISAVGHETDFTICDFVSDLRAPTPSAAAELVVRSKQALDDKVVNLRQRLARATRYQLLGARNSLTELMRHRAFGRTSDLIRRRQQRVDELSFRLSSATREVFKRYRQRVDVAAARIRYHDVRRTLAESRRVLDAQIAALAAALRNQLTNRRHVVERLSGRLEALSPVAILERGYALVFDGSGTLVKDASQLAPGTEMTARLSKGRVLATVKETIRE